MGTLLPKRVKARRDSVKLQKPEEYVKMIEELEDARLFQIAEERLKESSVMMDYSDINNAFGISEEDLRDYENVEID